MQISGFLCGIENLMIFLIFTAFPAKFDGVQLQRTNRARKYLMTPCFLGTFVCVEVSSTRKCAQIWSTNVWECLAGLKVTMKMYRKGIGCL